jgi:osmotically-inducible protein OsmY
MKKDIEIQDNVIEEIRNIPSVNASEIGVAVRNRIVTLTGTVESYPRKIAIEKAVSGIKNVRGIAEYIKVKLNGKDKRSDSDIAQAVLYSIEWHSGLDPEQVKILVEDGTVTLEGAVEWHYQRKLASETVSHITGVTNVINNIKLKSHPMPAEIREKINAAFLRSANIDSSKINVLVEGSKVTLRGQVKSWSEKNEAEHTVWSLPGVTEVNNSLEYTEESSEVLL